MKKILVGKNLLILILILIIVGQVMYYSKSNLIKGENEFGDLDNIAELNKDFDFYKYLFVYKSLLPDAQLKVVDDRLDKMTDDISKEDSKINNTLILVMMNEAINEDSVKSIVLELKDKVSKLVENSKIDKDTLFTKNTECAKLTSNIKEDLLKKYKNTSSREKEELNFIFYSPTLNSCLYTTKYDYSYSNYLGGNNEYYTRNSYKIYDVSSNKQLGDYPSYYYKYPNLSEEESDVAIKNGDRDYKKFILENSGYNAKLLKDMSIY